MSEGGETGAAAPKVRQCPICGRPAQADFLPFCAKRCADVDLHRWLSDSYRIPGSEDGGREQADDDI